MAEKIEVRLTKPLDGREIGTTAEYSEAEVRRLEARGAVERLTAKKAPKPRNKMAQPPENKSQS